MRPGDPHPESEVICGSLWACHVRILGEACFARREGPGLLNLLLMPYAAGPGRGPTSLGHAGHKSKGSAFNTGYDLSVMRM